MKRLIVKIILIAPMILLMSCRSINSNIHLQQYSVEEQEQLKETLIKYDNQLLYKIMIDYYNLRESLR